MDNEVDRGWSVTVDEVRREKRQPGRLLMFAAKPKVRIETSRNEALRKWLE